MTNISITDPVSLYVFYISSSLAKGRQKKTSSVIERNLTDSRLIAWYSPSRPNLPGLEVKFTLQFVSVFQQGCLELYSMCKVTMQTSKKDCRQNHKTSMRQEAQIGETKLPSSIWFQWTYCRFSIVILDAAVQTQHITNHLVKSENSSHIDGA